MNELEAVNVLLSNIGQSEVNSLTVGHPDVDNARKILARASKRVQRKGWWFNRDYNITLTPDSFTKKIRVSHLVEVVTSNLDYIQRGDFLYNRSAQTYEFELPITLISGVLYLGWDELPDSVQDVALFQAGAEFIRDELEDVNKEQIFLVKEREAMMALKAEDLKCQNYNIFNKPRVRRARAGVRPYSKFTS